MSAALLLSSQLETMAVTVRSDLNKLSVQEQMSVLQDAHAGGVDSLVERCENAKIDLKNLIEDTTAQLGEFSCEECAESSESAAALPASGMVSARRDGSAPERNGAAGWQNIASLVSEQLQIRVP